MASNASALSAPQSALVACVTLAIALPSFLFTLSTQAPLPLPDPPYDLFLARVASGTPPGATILLAHNPTAYTFFRAVYALAPRRVALVPTGHADYVITFGSGTYRFARTGR